MSSTPVRPGSFEPNGTETNTVAVDGDLNLDNGLWIYPTQFIANPFPYGPGTAQIVVVSPGTSYLFPVAADSGTMPVAADPGVLPVPQGG